MKNVLENGVFYAANQEYGLTFKQRTDLPVYRDDVLVYDVFDADGKQLAIFIHDPYARVQARRCMDERLRLAVPADRRQAGGRQSPQHSQAAGRPAHLLTWDEVTTMFHEFGHALHGMFSNVNTRISPAPACRATSSSSPRRSTRCGPTGRAS
jgi:peptidyl-dipeptidase Dcp